MIFLLSCKLKLVLILIVFFHFLMMEYGHVFIVEDFIVGTTNHLTSFLPLPLNLFFSLYIFSKKPIFLVHNLYKLICFVH